MQQLKWKGELLDVAEAMDYGGRSVENVVKMKCIEEALQWEMMNSLE